MSFGKEQVRSPQKVSSLSLRFLIDRDEEGNIVPQASYKFEVRDDLGASMSVRSGDLIPHLTPEERQALMGIFSRLRLLAEATVEP